MKALRVVHVETGMHLYGGARQVAYLLEGMAARGLGTVLICPPGAEIGRHGRGLAGVEVREIPCSGDVDLGFVWRLRTALKDIRPDLIHLHSRRGADVLGPLAARLAGVPAVLSRRVDNPENRLWAAIKYRLPARTICISEGIARVLADCGAPADRLRVARSALDPEPWRHGESREQFCHDFGRDPTRLQLGIVAQLIDRKGHRLLFEALAQCSTRESLQLTVFGRGPREADLRALAQSLGLGEAIHFAGFRDDMPRWMGALDLLVHPATMEGLGIALLQASAAGVPIIACRAGGMPEAVRDGRNGLLIEPGDGPALVSAIDRLAGDAALRRQLGDGGRALIDAEFSVAAMVERNVQVYRELLGRAD